MRFKKLNEMTDEELNKELKKWSLFSAVVLVMLGGSLYALKKVNNNEEKNGKTTKNRLADDNDKLYRMDIDEKYLDNVIWIDNEGKTTNKTYIDSSKDVQVVSLEKNINKNENYYMFFVDDDGNIERGKVSGEFINSEVLQEITPEKYKSMIKDTQKNMTNELIKILDVEKEFPNEINLVGDS